MGSERLGWPGRWHNGHLYDDGGEPVHLFPFPVTADGHGPCDASDPAYDHDICWCHFDGCTGDEDGFGFPATADPDDESTWQRPCWQCGHVPGCAWMPDVGYAACPACLAD